MIIGAILISLAILVLMVIFVTRPLYKAEQVEQSETENDEGLANVEYQQTLSRIRDLEQDHLEGKINDVDYQSRRDMLNKEAAEALHKLDSGQNNRE